MNVAAMLLVVATAAAQSTTSGVVREYVPPPSVAPVCEDVIVPSNLNVSPVYRDLIDRMLRRSATFRRQITRIAAARQLTVFLRQIPQASRHDVRATTRFVRQDDGYLSAHIIISPLQDDVELIGHELEHVIEQLDDVDLVAKAGRPNSGVHKIATLELVYETTRATRVGLQVAQEAR
jgi:hypothetical protein